MIGNWWLYMNDSKVLPQNACSLHMEQCWNGLCYWSRSIEWIWVECAQYVYQWDGLLHVGWKEEHFVLEILIHSVIMCILYYCYMDYNIENCMRENGNGWECDWLWYLSRTRFQSLITENEWAILQISFWSECGMIRHMFYIRWIIDADKNRVINRVDQYCELQWIFMWLNEWT